MGPVRVTDPSRHNSIVAFARGETKRMAIMRALTIGVVVALAVSSPAFAGGKGGGHSSTETPKSSTSLNYGKVEWSYSKQKPDGTASANATAAKKGKVNVKDISVTKKTDTSGPNLYKHTSTGKHIPKAKIEF